MSRPPRAGPGRDTSEGKLDAEATLGLHPALLPRGKFILIRINGSFKGFYFIPSFMFSSDAVCSWM